jgi:molybdopterin-biosynthesis enzyme MoeA-like protein
MKQAAEIIIVGDEVLAAEVVDANGPILLATLARLGTRASGVRIVSDSRSEVTRAVPCSGSGSRTCSSFPASPCFSSRS